MSVANLFSISWVICVYKLFFRNKVYKGKMTMLLIYNIDIDFPQTYKAIIKSKRKCSDQSDNHEMCVVVTIHKLGSKQFERLPNWFWLEPERFEKIIFFWIIV